MFELLNEIAVSLSKNKLRAFLTGFSVAWGIFMFVILLGSGTGLENGIKKSFRSAMNNTLWIFAGQTSSNYEGMKKGRKIIMTNEDYEYIRSSVPKIDMSSSRYTVESTNTISYKDEYGVFEVRTCKPAYRTIENIKQIEGRFINETDEKEYRKVAIISTNVRDNLFKGINHLGEYVTANKTNFKVVGIFEDIDDWDNNRCIYIPVSTAQRVFSGGNRISMISVTMGNATVEESRQIEKDIRMKLAERHQFDKEDERAIDIGNNLARFSDVMNLISMIRLFIWVIGIFTIIAGIVGISNIMTISVAERTKEIGIRKAIGARPTTIVLQIILESVIITAVAGYIGLVLGVGLLELISSILPQDGFFLNPKADIGLAISMTILLVVSGTIAGIFPARKAAGIKPIEALKDE